MRQSLQQIWPERGRGGLSPVAFGGITPLKSGVSTVGTRSVPSYGGRIIRAIVWRRRAPHASIRQRMASWRARNWRRALLAWAVLSLVVLAIASEPRTDFPKAQAGSVPAVRMVLRVAGGLTVAGVPVLLIALP